MLKRVNVGDQPQQKKPLARVGAWGFRKISKDYEEMNKNNRTESIE